MKQGMCVHIPESHLLWIVGKEEKTPTLLILVTEGKGVASTTNTDSFKKMDKKTEGWKFLSNKRCWECTSKQNETR